MLRFKFRTGCRVMLRMRSGQRHLGALDRLIIWCSFNPIFLKLFGLEHDWQPFLKARGQTADFFSEELFLLWKIWVYRHHISDYSCDVLVLLIIWLPGQLFGWTGPVKDHEIVLLGCDTAFVWNFVNLLPQNTESHPRNLNPQQYRGESLKTRNANDIS